MPPRQSNFVSADVIDNDREALVQLRRLPNYMPASPDFGIAELDVLELQVRTTEEAVLAAQQALTVARNARDKARWQFHQRMLGVKAIVRALFGPNSDAIQALGLKRKNDYLRPTRRSKDV